MHLPDWRSSVHTPISAPTRSRRTAEQGSPRSGACAKQCCKPSLIGPSKRGKGHIVRFRNIYRLLNYSYLRTAGCGLCAEHWLAPNKSILRILQTAAWTSRKTTFFEVSQLPIDYERGHLVLCKWHHTFTFGATSQSNTSPSLNAAMVHLGSSATSTAQVAEEIEMPTGSM